MPFTRPTAAATLNGIGVSRGHAIGQAVVLWRNELDIPEYSLPEHERDAEVERLWQALAAARQQLLDVSAELARGPAADMVAVLDTHLLMLQDSSLRQAPVELIRRRGCNAEWALQLQRDRLVAVFREMTDPYLRARQQDVSQVVARVQKLLLTARGHTTAPGAVAPASQPGAAPPLADRIVVADDLTPADTVMMQTRGVLAFVTEFGGPLSHTAILARSLGIPAVVGAHGLRKHIRSGQWLAIDGDSGAVLAGPDRPTLAYYRVQQRAERRRRRALDTLAHEATVSQDGVTVSLQANVELPEEIAAARRCGADGVGLYRTEFLFMNRQDLPDEEEQFEAYRSVVEAFAGRPVTIRTLDLGADKPLLSTPSAAPAPGAGPLPTAAANPALGLRAIRLCLREPALFRPQLRAILRASGYGPVRLMLPMLSSLPEVRQALLLIDQLKQELLDEGHRIAPQLPVGGMIEVPAAAVAAPYFARRLDFLSIGTNDLIQYALAIDRVDDSVNYLYDPLHPAVLRLIAMTLEAGRQTGIPVSLCGEMAGDSRYTRLLLGLGLTELSTPPNRLLEIKQAIRETRIADLGALCRQLIATDDAAELTTLLTRLGAVKPVPGNKSY